MYIVACVVTLTLRVKGFHALAPEISGGNIVSIEAIVTGEPRSVPEGTWVMGGIETPCKCVIYADKKLKSKIRKYVMSFY